MADSTPSTTPDTVEEEVGSSVERRSVLWLTNFSHGVNHFQNEMLAILYLEITDEMGFNNIHLGVLIAIRSVFGGAVEVCGNIQLTGPRNLALPRDDTIKDVTDQSNLVVHKKGSPCRVFSHRIYELEYLGICRT